MHNQLREPWPSLACERKDELPSLLWPMRAQFHPLSVGHFSACLGPRREGGVGHKPAGVNYSALAKTPISSWRLAEASVTHICHAGRPHSAPPLTVTAAAAPRQYCAGGRGTGAVAALLQVLSESRSHIVTRHWAPIHACLHRHRPSEAAAEQGGCWLGRMLRFRSPDIGQELSCWRRAAMVALPFKPKRRPMAPSALGQGGGASMRRA